MTQVLAISLFLIVLAGVAWRIAGSEATNNVAALVSAVVAVAASIVGLRRPSQAQAEIETVASLLAGAVRKQWEEVRERDGLSELLPVRFAPVDSAEKLGPTWTDLVRAGRSATGSAPAAAGAPARVVALEGDLTEIASAFARIPTKRLVVLGRAGAGKSILARHLTLCLLRDRQPGDPVPFFVQLTSWEPSTERFVTWLEDQLAQALEMVGTFTRPERQLLARRLIDDHRIMPVLDGLDEVTVALRVRAICELNASRAAQDHLVITCRKEEYREAVESGEFLERSAVVELEPLAPEDVAAYLCAPGGRTAARWERVVAQFGRAGRSTPLTDVLTTPLYVTLARAIYDPRTRPDPRAHRFFRGADPGGEVDVPDPQELLRTQRFPDRDALRTYLLGAFITAAYRGEAPDGRRGRWTAAQALHWHTTIAGLLREPGSAGLAWWELWRQAPRRVRTWAFGVAAGTWLGLFFGLFDATGSGMTVGEAALEGLSFGATAAVAAGWATGSRMGSPPSRPREGVGARPRELFPVVVAGILGSVLAGGLFRLALANGNLMLDGTAGPALLVSVVLGGGFVAGVIGSALLLRLFSPEAVALERTVSPRRVLARDRWVFVAFGLVGWPLVIAVAAILFLLLLAATGQSPSGGQYLDGEAEAVLLLGFALVPPCLFGFGLAWGWSRAGWAFFVLARAWLAARGELPWRLMRFLDDACGRGVLRQVGAYYQFRHAELQRHLGPVGSGPGQASSPDRVATIAAVRRWRIEQGPGTRPATADARSVATSAVDRLLSATPFPVQGEFIPEGASSGVPLSVAEAFERANRRLLVVGPPGAGKTTSALELVDHLLAQATAHPQAGVPELFALASWPQRQQPLVSWLEDEMRQRGLDPDWVRQGRLIPVLDGLDEVEQSCRAACLQAITGYGDGRAVILTCRGEEYDRLAAHTPAPPLGGRYLPRPLDDAALDAVLIEMTRENSAWEPVREAVHQGQAPVLRRLWSAPLWLRTAVVAYHSGDPRGLLQTPSPEQQEWDAFLDTTARAGGRYPVEQVRRWLGWLATPACQRGELRLHRLQSPSTRVGSARGRQALAAGVVSGVLVSPGPALLIGWDRVLELGRPVNWPGLLVITALVYGLAFGAMGALMPGSSYVRGPIGSGRRVASGVGYGLACWLAQSLTQDLAAGLLDPSHPFTGAPWWLPVAFGLLVARVGGISADPSYAPAWSNALLPPGLLAGFIAGVLALLAVLSAGTHGLPGLLPLVLATALVVAAIRMLGYAGSPPGPPVEGTATWTAAMARTGTAFAAVTAAAAACAVVLLYATAAMVFDRWLGGRALAWSVAFATLAFTSTGVVFGWAAVGWNVVLRARCWRRGLLPRQPTTFLTWCAGQGYVRSCGGSYRWLHPEFAHHLGVASGHPAPADHARSEPVLVRTLRRVGGALRRPAAQAGQVSPRRYLPKRAAAAVAALALASLVGTLVLTAARSVGRDDSVRVLRGHADTVRAVAITPDGRQIITGSADTSVRVWDLQTGQPVKTLTYHAASVAAVAVTPDGRYLISSSYDTNVLVWDLQTGRPLGRLPGDPVYVYALAISRDGHRVVGGAVDGTVRVWDLPSGRLIRTLRNETSSPSAAWDPSKAVMAVAISPDSRQVLGAGQDRTVRIWDLATGQQIHMLSGATYWVGALTVTPDGRTVISGDFDRAVRLWDLATGRPQRVLNGHLAAVGAVAVTPNGRQLVTGSDDRTLRIWDLASGKLLRTLQGHKGPVTAVAITPDGRFAVSASADTTVRVWSLDR